MRLVICEDCRANVTGGIPPPTWESYVEVSITGETSPVIDLCPPCANKPFRRRFFKICSLRDMPR